MKINVDKSFQVCGNNNRYQRLFFLAVALTWFSVDFVSISFPLLELMPNFKCKSGDVWQDCTDEQYCNIENPEDRQAIVNYVNIVTDFELYCNKTLVIIIGVIYTLGIFLGAILASKFCDKLGRKPVLLLCHFLFACGGLTITIAPNVYFLFGILFLIGISSAGGTMVSFLFIYEVLAPNVRSIYGTLINSSFAVAGIIYFTSFQYIKDWKIIAYMCTATDILSGLLILTYFTESPRFLLSQGKVEKGLKALYKIAKKNGKRKDFYKYLMSDLSIQQDYKENIFSDAERNEDQINGYASDANFFNNNLNSQDSNKSTFIESPVAVKKSIEQLVQGIKNDSDSSDDNGVKEEPFLAKSSSGSVYSKDDQNINVKSASVNKEAGFTALIKYKSIRTSFLICCFLWFAMAFTYYGISMGIKNNKDSVFTDGYVVYTAEGISYFITGILISIAFFGRTRTISIMILICSIAAFSYYFVRLYKFEPYDKIPLFLARFGITGVYSIMYTYSTEVYPTSIRAKGLGINTIFGRLAAIMVPVIVELFNPFLIYAVLCSIGFVLTFNLPETFGKELEDEILEEKSKKVFSNDNVTLFKN
jgi:MFS family permease